MNQKSRFALALLLCAAGLGAADPVEFPEKADWNDSPQLKTLADDVLELNNDVITSTELIKIDPKKKTHLTGEFRALPGKKARLFFAFSSYDAQKQPISAIDVNAVKGSDTELLAPVKKDDRTLKVKDASRFLPGTVVVFNTKEDYSDLPNRVRSHGFFEKAEKQPDGTWIVTLKAKAGQDFPAGTKVRAHGSGGYQYVAITELDGSWKKLGGFCTGMAKVGLGGKEWRPGSAYVKAVIFGAKPEAPIQFRNVKLTEQE